MREIIMPLSIDDIDIPPGRREVDPGVVKRLANSIDNVGLRHPITVRKKGERYILVAGRHRIEACRKLGREHVQATIVSMTNAEARMWEIAENLHRAELTKLQRSDNIAEWVHLCDEQRARGVSVQNEQKPGRPESGVSAASRELGIDRVEAQRAVQIASLTDEAKEAAEEAGIDDNQSKLLAVAREPEERQVAKVYELKGVPISKNWRDQFQTLWGKGTEDDHAWARDYIDKPIMDARHG